MSVLFPFFVALAVVLVPLTGQQDHQHGTEKLGTVRFATSCSAAAQPVFARAMALLHSFEFAAAIEGFTAAETTDPGCAIADWGIALSRWGNPFAAGLKTPAQLDAGRAAIARAKTIGAQTARERDYIAAAERLFADFEKTDQRTRLLAYRDAMSDLATRYADDPEASAFYALALAASNDPTDRTYASLIKAGAILERLAPAQPDHPGFVHYIIHAYDVPPLAAKALAAARSYAKIAPSAPHALHMPSHTFTRLGYWQDSIETNIASAQAARREGATGEELHAMDYQAYAYLQTAQDGAARRLADTLPEVSSRFDPSRGGSAAPPLAGVFALAAIPARYALERQAWARGGEARGAAQPLPAGRCHHVVRTRPWRGAHRGSAGRPRGDRRLAAARGAAHEGGRDLLGRAGRDPAARRVRVDRVQGPQDRRGGSLDDNARGSRARGSDREECRHAGADRPGARAARLHAAGRRSLGRRSRRVRDNAQERAESVPRALRRRCRRAEEGRCGGESHLRAAAADSGGTGRRARSPAAGVGQGNRWSEVKMRMKMRRVALLVVCGLAAGVVGHAQAPESATAVVQRIRASAPFTQASTFIEGDYDRFVKELVALNEIPAPPFKEEARAKAYLEMLRQAGLSDVEMDAEGNAMGVRKGSGAGPMVAVVAHLDTVFPEGTDVKVKRQGTRLAAPGIGDNTRGIALMLAVVRAMQAAKFQTTSDVLFVGNVGEEGEGDLRGVKFLLRQGKYKDRIKQFIAIDGGEQGNITRGGVGSLRYRVIFKGPGGHSYGAFGLVNPAFAMGSAIAKFSRLHVPVEPKTTFNIGVVRGRDLRQLDSRRSQHGRGHAVGILRGAEEGQRRVSGRRETSRRRGERGPLDPGRKDRSRSEADWRSPVRRNAPPRRRSC